MTRANNIGIEISPKFYFFSLQWHIVFSQRASSVDRFSLKTSTEQNLYILSKYFLKLCSDTNS